jgi:DNA helicase-2/ATP-dependent DNA helicase PcrA
MIHGQTDFSRPSRFLSEIPRDLVEELRPSGTQVAPARARSQAPQDADGLALGTQVRHPRFGLGTVVTIEGQGANARIQINFEAAGSKWLVLGYATLEPVA